MLRQDPIGGGARNRQATGGPAHPSWRRSGAFAICRRLAGQHFGAGRLRMLADARVQQVFAYQTAGPTFVLRWCDVDGNALFRPSAEREALAVLQSAGFDGVPQFLFRESVRGGEVTGLSYVPGRAQQGAPSGRELLQAAARLATLHEALLACRHDSGTAWDADRWQDGLDELDRYVALPTATSRRVEALMLSLRALEHRARSDNRQWGVVHSDPHWSNWLFDGPRIGLIDFAESGPGLYLMDLAVLLTDLWVENSACAEVFGEPMIAAYLAARSGPVDPRPLHLLMQVRVMDSLAWSLPSMGASLDDCESVVARVSRRLTELVESPPRWVSRLAEVAGRPAVAAPAAG